MRVKKKRPVGVVLNESMSYSVIFVSKHLCGVCREEFVTLDIFFFSGVFGVLLSLHSINLQEKELGPVNFAKVQGCSKVLLFK